MGNSISNFCNLDNRDNNDIQTINKSRRSKENIFEINHGDLLKAKNINSEQNLITQKILDTVFDNIKKQNNFHIEKPITMKINEIKFEEIVLEKGLIYKGQTMNGEMHGIGVIHKNGELIYEGSFKYNKYDGEGKLIIDNEIYSGFFLKGKKSGHGLLTNSLNKYRYEGEFKEDMKDGEGTEIIDNLYKYIGEFKEDHKHGKGRIKFLDGREYEGEFIDGKFEGKGKFTYSEGKLYYGEWLNSVKTGYGILIDQNEIYKGYFFNDKKNGYGVMIYKDQSFLIGKWNDNKVDGLALYYDQNNEENIQIHRKNRNKKIIKECGEIEEIKKTDEYKILLDFFEESEKRNIE